MAKGNGKGNLTDLKLLSYSDRELLIIVMEQADADPDGYADTKVIADTLGVRGEKRLNSVGSRLAAMRRIGAIEKMDGPMNVRSRWAVSPIGKVLATGVIDARTQKQLEALGPEAMLLVTRFLTGVYRTAPETASHLIRREWVHGTGRY